MSEFAKGSVVVLGPDDGESHVLPSPAPSLGERAEVAIPRDLFADRLQRIAALRPPPGRAHMRRSIGMPVTAHSGKIATK